MGCSHPKTTNLFGIYKPKGMPGTQGPGNRVAIYGLEFTNGYVNVTTIDGDEKASFTVSGKYLTIAVPINVAANVGCLPTAITICPPGTEVIPGHPTGEVQQEVFTIKDD